MKLPATLYPALQKFVMKGITTKTAARDAVQELRDLITELEERSNEMEDALCTWEEGADPDDRADGRATLEDCVNAIDSALSEAGYCAGQLPYSPPE